MDLALLRTLVVVAETGSFTAAAQQLCVTQSAVSRRIRQLEEHYGVPLLERGADVTRPTNTGLVLLDKARRILEIEQEIEDTTGLLRKQHRVSFGCTPCFGTGRLPDIFEKFVGAFGLNFDLNIIFQMPEDVLGGLTAGRYDLAVIEHCDDLDLDGYAAYPLPSDEMVFVSAPTLALPAGDIDIATLTSRRLLLKTHNGCAYRFLRRGLRQIGHEIAEFVNVTYYDDLSFVVRQVVGGHGIGFVSRELASREIDGGLLRTHRVADFDHERPRTLIVSPRFRPTDITCKFLDVFFQSLGVEPPECLCEARQDLPVIPAE